MIDQSLNISQSQQQRLSPQVLQTLQVIHMSSTDVLQAIRKELHDNPALELETPPGKFEHLQQGDAHKDSITNFEQGFLPSSPEPSTEFSQELDLYNTGESLHGHLIAQLELSEFSAKEKQLARLLIDNLDANGFHILDPENLSLGYSHESFSRVLSKLQTLDPLGTAVANFQESLILQAKLRDDCPPQIEAFIYELFPLHKSSKAEKIFLGEQEKTLYMQFLQNLNPFPGKQYSSSTTQYILPDAEISIRDNKLHIQFFRSRIPKLRINPRFLQMTTNQKAKHSPSAKTPEGQFAQGYIKQGKQFIYNLQLRQQSTERIITRVAERQKAYFFRGLAAMQVLKVHDLAEALGISTSTVSRIANTRYIRCSDGIHSLRFFFSLGLVSEQGSFARIGIKYMIRDLITHSTTKLSDERIRMHLGNNGVSIARRTVAKYRKELGFLRQRKRRTQWNK